MNRREFLKASAVSVFSTGVVDHLYGASSAGQEVSIPRRTLGKTGEMVSIIGFGGGSRFCRVKDEDEAIGLINLAIDMGINYFDTAPVYGNGLSERRYGKVMKHRKEEVFLATKTIVRSRDGALAQIEGSLKRLQTDVIDLVQIHCLSREEEVRQIGKPDGALAAIRRLQEEGVIRFVGVTGHPNAEVIKEAIRVYDFDTVMVPLNATREGGYEETVLPKAVESEMGVIAIKTLGQRAFVGQGKNKAPATELIRYSLSLPITLTVIGMDSTDVLVEDISLVRSLEPMSEREMNLLSARMSGAGGTGYWNKLPNS
ncbi:aldo/keto reductase [Candidatus Poribacteria bacterium]